MKNNSIYPVLSIVIAVVAAVVYAVLYVTGTAPAVVPLATTGRWLSLLVLGTLALMPLLCRCKKDGLCAAVKNYAPWVIIAAMGNLIATGLLSLFTTTTSITYTLSQIAAVLFGVLLATVWGFFLYEVIRASLCSDKPYGYKPPKDDCGDFSYSDNKYKY